MTFNKYNIGMDKNNLEDKKVSKDHAIMMDEILVKEGIVPNEQTMKLVTRGGLRPNSGRPRGSRNKMTKDIKAKEKTIKERITKNLDELVNAQLSLAKGLFFMYEIKMRNIGGRRKPEHIQVKDPKKIKAFLDGELEGEYYYISAQAPENKAIDSLLDRAFGKATSETNVNHDFNINVIDYGKKELIAEPRDIEVVEPEILEAVTSSNNLSITK
jgi:hypothetical protein